jgi:phage-related protein
MATGDRPLVWLRSEIKTPPLSTAARIEAGVLLRRLQRGEQIGMPHARSLPVIGKRCLELRIPDNEQTWRIICRLDPDAVIVLEVFSKKTQKTPQRVIELSRQRLKEYDQAVGGSDG